MMPAHLTHLPDASEPAPQIWVDADACPVVIRDILCRAAERAGVQTTFVANQFLRKPPSRHVRALQVSGGFELPTMRSPPARDQAISSSPRTFHWLHA